MRNEELELTALAWMTDKISFQQKEFENLLFQDNVFQSSSIQELKKQFLESFNNLGAERADWVFCKSLNDALLAEKNYIPCPLW